VTKYMLQSRDFHLHLIRLPTIMKKTNGTVYSSGTSLVNLS